MTAGRFRPLSGFMRSLLRGTTLATLGCGGPEARVPLYPDAVSEDTTTRDTGNWPFELCYESYSQFEAPPWGESPHLTCAEAEGLVFHDGDCWRVGLFGGRVWVADLQYGLRDGNLYIQEYDQYMCHQDENGQVVISICNIEPFDPSYVLQPRTGSLVSEIDNGPYVGQRFFLVSKNLTDDNFASWFPRLANVQEVLEPRATTDCVP